MRKSWPTQFTRSLSFKQARIAVIAGFILGLGFSAAQIVVDLRREIHQIDLTFEQSLRAFEEPAFQAAFGLDDVLAQTVVNGLFQQSAIIEAKIIDSYGDTMYSKSRPHLDNTLSWLAEGLFGGYKSYSTQLVGKETGFLAGELIIRVDTNLIAKSFFQRSGLVLVFGVLRNLFLAIILALLFHNMLTKPLRKIAKLIQKGSGKLTVSVEHETDELGDIVFEYNRLSQDREKAVMRLEEEERRYRRLFENSVVSLANTDYSQVTITLNRLRRKGVIDLRLYLDANENVAWEMFAEIDILSVNMATLNLFEASSECQLVQQASRTFSPNTIKMFKDQLCAIWENKSIFRAETTFYTLNGNEIIGIISLPIPETEDGFRSIPVSILDITEFKKAETELTFRGEIIEAMGEGVQATRMSDGVIIYTNAMLDATFGYHRGDLIGEYVGILNAKTDTSPEETAEHIFAEIETNGSWVGEIENIRKDGSSFWSEVSVTKFVHPIHGSLAIGVQSDISDRKQLEDQLRQSQRMEAVGQLTGGLAHDFNNLLAVMLGNAELLEDIVGEDKNAKEFIESIKAAVARSSSLTGRLLAFSRQSALAPVAADVSELIGGLNELLRRALGATVALTVDETTDLWPAMIDTHQFENALVNLSLNARDAMPQGGILTIQVANVTLDEAYALQHEEVSHGDYVEVVVSDTGTGIPPDVLAKVFEPFFTTKEVGKGTGLGLSMVFGFVKQSNGHITISSEVGHGTSVKLYMPRSQDGATGTDVKDDVLEHAQGSERILVVEDDSDVRKIPTAILRDQGYEVVEAENGGDVAKLLQDGSLFDLLFTDVVLPGGMNGVEIADQAQKLQPNIKVLFATGYAENSIDQISKMINDGLLINKPYLRAELLEKVRNVLDSEHD